MSGFFRPAAEKMSTTSSDTMARDTIWRIAWSRSSASRWASASPFAIAALTVWKNATSSRMAIALSCVAARANARESCVTASDSPGFAILLLRDVVLGIGQQTHSIPRIALPLRPVKTVEQAAANLILLDHHVDRLFRIDGRVSLAAALGVDGEGIAELLGQPQVIHHQPARLVPEHSRLTRAMACISPWPAHRLVHVHGVEARRIEARQPHITHDHDLERIIRGS